MDAYLYLSQEIYLAIRGGPYMTPLRTVLLFTTVTPLLLSSLRLFPHSFLQSPLFSRDESV